MLYFSLITVFFKIISYNNVQKLLGQIEITKLNPLLLLINDYLHIDVTPMIFPECIQEENKK